MILLFVIFSLLVALVFSAGHDFIEAAKNGHLETVQDLLEERSSEFSDHVLNGAIREAGNDDTSREVARFLIERGGALDDYALPSAAKKGHSETVKFLLEASRGAVNERTLRYAMFFAINDKTSLELAHFLVGIGRIGSLNRALINVAWRGYFETVQYLLNARPDSFSNNDLNLAISRAGTDQIGQKVAHFLIDRQGIVNVSTLINVAKKGHLDTLQCLLYDGSVEFTDAQLDSFSAAAGNNLIRDLYAERVIPK